MPGSEQAALLPLPIVRDAIRPRSLPFDPDDSSLGGRFGRNQGRFRPNRQPCAPHRQTNHQVRHATFTLTFLTFT